MSEHGRSAKVGLVVGGVLLILGGVLVVLAYTHWPIYGSFYGPANTQSGSESANLIPPSSRTSTSPGSGTAQQRRLL